MKIEKNITICFDTNTYDNTKYFFNGSFYTTFKDLKMSYPNLKIYVEPIIYNEVITHLRNLAKDTTKETEKLLKIFKSLDIFTNVKEALEITDLEEKYFQEAKKKFEEFIKFFSDEEIEKRKEMVDVIIVDPPRDGINQKALKKNNLLLCKKKWSTSLAIQKHKKETYKF